MLGDEAGKRPGMLIVVQLIWLLQPLSHFSNEIGHVIFHAFELATRQVEPEAFSILQGEVFMQQMIHPSIAQMKLICDLSCREKSVRSKVKEESLDFWRQTNLPSVGAIWSLFELETDAST
jgi:hypothetical protein